MKIPWNPRKRNQELEPSISVLGAESTSNKIWWGCRGLVEAGPSSWTPWNPWKVEAGTGFRCGKIIGKPWENLWEKPWFFGKPFTDRGKIWWFTGKIIMWEQYIINHPKMGTVYSTYLWWFGGWFMALFYPHERNCWKIWDNPPPFMEVIPSPEY